MNLKVFKIGYLVLVTVNSSRGCQHYAFYLGVANSFHQRHCPADIHTVIAAWEKRRLGHADFGCQVEDAIYILQQFPKQGLFVDVSLDKFNFG